MTTGGPTDRRTTELPLQGRLLAVDVGEKRIGIAMSDPTQMIAQPLTTLTRRSGKRFPMRALKTHLDVHQPVGFVVGLPLAPSGTEDERAARVRAVGTLLTEKTALPVVYWDERMSTARALSAIKEMRGRARGRKADVDRLAATVLLQTFLDSRRQ